MYYNLSMIYCGLSMMYYILSILYCGHSYLYGREDVAAASCAAEFDGCSGGKLMSISLEYTGRSLPGNTKKPNAEWNHLQGSGDTLFKGFTVADNFPEEGNKLINKMPITVARFNMADQASLKENNGKFVAQPGDIINLNRSSYL